MNVFPTRRGNRVTVSFPCRAKVELTGTVPERFHVSFSDRSTGAVLYRATIGTDMWLVSDARYYVPWRIELQNADDASERYVYDLELRGEPVGILNSSSNLGDTIAWMPFVEEFQRVHGCVVLYQTALREIFEKEYPEIRFVDRIEESPHDGGLFISYELSLWLGPGGRSLHRRPYQEVPVQQIASDILGLRFRERRPRLTVPKVLAAPERRYVCIATQSTAQAKYWTADGWDAVVAYLAGRGYEVRCIDRDRVFGAGDTWNSIPRDCVDHTGNLPLRERITELAGCDFFVGLSSGLAWLAWALRKPVVMISGFTEPRNEFFTPYRVIDRSVCHGCWNDPRYEFDRNDWLWCPRLGDTERRFECSRRIGFEQVRAQLDACIADRARAQAAQGTPGVLARDACPRRNPAEPDP